MNGGKEFQCEIPIFEKMRFERQGKGKQKTKKN